MKIIWFVILSLFGIGSLIVYQGQKGKIRMYDDAKSMKKEVLRLMPIGTLIPDAKRIMEENDFRCAFYKNEGFIERQENDPEGKGAILHDNADFLLCSKNGTPFMGVMREWRVILVHKDDVISDIFVNTWVTGP